MSKIPKKYEEKVKGHYKPSTGKYIENYERKNIHYIMEHGFGDYKKIKKSEADEYDEMYEGETIFGTDFNVYESKKDEATVEKIKKVLEEMSTNIIREGSGYSSITKYGFDYKPNTYVEFQKGRDGDVMIFSYDRALLLDILYKAKVTNIKVDVVPP